MIGYKLLTHDMKTRAGCTNEMDWSDIGEWHEATGPRGQELCSNGYLHSYDDLRLAVLMNPIHADIADPICYECEIEGDTISDGLKRGSRRIRLTRQVELPVITIEQRVWFAILCVRAIPNRLIILTWETWADNWMSGRDRTIDAAYAAACAANAAANAANAACAADAAVDAACAAVYAADAACAAVDAAYINFTDIAKEACNHG